MPLSVVIVNAQWTFCDGLDGCPVIGNGALLGGWSDLTVDIKLVERDQSKKIPPKSLKDLNIARPFDSINV